MLVSLPSVALASRREGMAEAEGRAERGAAAPPANAPPLTEAQREVLAAFWQQVGTDASRVHVREQLSAINLPLARIKKIMKSDEDVRMISSEAPALFAKACELFVLELTLRAWIHSEEHKRRTLQRSDIAAAISHTDLFDFLVDLVPASELRPGASPGASASISPHVAGSSVPLLCPASSSLLDKPPGHALSPHPPHQQEEQEQVQELDALEQLLPEEEQRSLPSKPKQADDPR